MTLSTVHISIMMATVVFVLGAGIYAARSVKTAAGYSLGGRSAGVSLIAGSIAGTIIGGGATVGTAQLAYSYGLAAWWFTLGSGIGLAIMGILYAKRMRQSGLTTIPEFLSTCYGKRAEGMASVIASVGIVLSIIASTLPGIQMLSALFGLSHWEAAAVLLFLVMGYTFFGGMKSAGIGGILKMVVIFISLFAAGWSAFKGLMNMTDFGRIFPSVPWLSLFGEGVEPALANLCSVVVGVLCTQTYVQAIFSAASPLKASAGCLMAAAIVIPVGLPSVAIGMYMRAFEPVELPILVLPLYLIHHESEILAGIAIGGIILSLIGSIGGLALGVGTMVSHDLIGPVLHIRDDRNMLCITRISVVLVIAMASAVAMANLETEVLFWNYLSMALRGGGIFLPLTIAVFWPGLLSRKWVLSSMFLSTAASVLAASVIPLPVPPLFAGLFVSGGLTALGILSRRAQT